MGDEKTYPLHKVVQYRNIRKIEILLPETKDINEKDEKGQTVLHIACEQEVHNDKIMELLLSHPEIDPSVTNQDGFNALHLLAFKGNLTWIKELFGKFPDMVVTVDDVTDKGNTPLILAAKMNHLEIIRYLHGKGNLTWIKELFGKFPDMVVTVDDVTDKGNTPLILAAKMNHLEIIRYLHGKGANINHENDKKFTALFYAANNGYVETTKALLQLGSKVNHRDDYGNTPLKKAASWGFVEVCKILLEHDADVNVSDHRGQTALTQAIRRSNIEAVRILLEHGADPNHIVSNGNKYFTPLISACLSKRVDLIEILIEFGVDVNYPKPHSIALFTCVKHGFCDGVRALINAGVDLKAAGPHGGTALQSARKYNHRDIVRLLEYHL